MNGLAISSMACRHLHLLSSTSKVDTSAPLRFKAPLPACLGQSWLITLRVSGQFILDTDTMDFWFSSSLYGLPMSSLHPESALAGVMNEDAKCQPLLRDISFSSNSSQSLLSTPTLSSFSYTQSSSGFSGLDTPPESIQDEDFEFCVDSTPRLDALGEVNEERLHRAMTFPRSGHLELDLDGGYESEVEDSQKFVRQKLRKRFSTPSAAPATKQKAGLAPRRPTSGKSTFKFPLAQVANLHTFM